MVHFSFFAPNRFPLGLSSACFPLEGSYISCPLSSALPQALPARDFPIFSSFPPWDFPLTLLWVHWYISNTGGGHGLLIFFFGFCFASPQCDLPGTSKVLKVQSL